MIDKYDFEMQKKIIRFANKIGRSDLSYELIEGLITEDVFWVEAKKSTGLENYSTWELKYLYDL
jgi:hypothetical protein